MMDECRLRSVIIDGITEAMNKQQKLNGKDRLYWWLNQNRKQEMINEKAEIERKKVEICRVEHR